jgi:L-alanine-DL-glutamate epimerase-like enolase superfamily enzyme
VTNRQVDCGFASLAFDKVKPPRQAFAPGVEFMLDLSGGLATDETIRLCRRFEELDITWIEEPADLFDVGTLKETSKRVAIDGGCRRARVEAQRARRRTAHQRLGNAALGHEQQIDTLGAMSGLPP